jgi:hypothetical protein
LNRVLKNSQLFLAFDRIMAIENLKKLLIFLALFEFWLKIKIGLVGGSVATDCCCCWWWL